MIWKSFHSDVDKGLEPRHAMLTREVTDFDRPDQFTNQCSGGDLPTLGCFCVEIITA